VGCEFVEGEKRESSSGRRAINRAMAYVQGSKCDALNYHITVNTSLFIMNVNAVLAIIFLFSIAYLCVCHIYTMSMLLLV
jgi:hypothetical protein